MSVHPSDSPAVGIRDVARLAGVSLGSASRVINHASNVMPETRQKVEAAIAALGYRPNHAAQSLRTRATRTIGCMFSDVSNPLYAQLYLALEESFRARGYMLLLANSKNILERELEILTTFQARGMDGLLITPGNERSPALRALLEGMKMPTVVLDRDISVDVDQVQFDHVPAVKRVVRGLADMGHRRIALLVTQGTHRPIRRRIEGYCAGLKDSGLPLDVSLIVRLPSIMSSSREAFGLLLDGEQPPTAVLAMGTNLLHGALSAINARGLRVPQDVTVVSMGDPAFAAHHTPSISAIRVDAGRATETASGLLLARLSGSLQGPGKIHRLSCDFIERESWGPAPGFAP